MLLPTVSSYYASVNVLKISSTTCSLARYDILLLCFVRIELMMLMIKKINKQKVIIFFSSNTNITVPVNL